MIQPDLHLLAAIHLWTRGSLQCHWVVHCGSPPSSPTLAWNPLEARNSNNPAPPNAAGGWWIDRSVFDLMILSFRCILENEGVGLVDNGEKSLTVLSMPLTATMGNVGCCSITGESAQNGREMGRRRTIHHMSVTFPYTLQATSILVPNEEIAIIAPRTDLVGPRAEEVALKSVLVGRAICPMLTILYRLHVSRSLETSSRK